MLVLIFIIITILLLVLLSIFLYNYTSKCGNVFLRNENISKCVFLTYKNKKTKGKDITELTIYYSGLTYTNISIMNIRLFHLNLGNEDFKIIQKPTDSKWRIRWDKGHGVMNIETKLEGRELEKDFESTIHIHPQLPSDMTTEGVYVFK